MEGLSRDPRNFLLGLDNNDVDRTPDASNGAEVADRSCGKSLDRDRNADHFDGEINRILNGHRIAEERVRQAINQRLIRGVFQCSFDKGKLGGSEIISIHYSGKNVYLPDPPWGGIVGGP